MSDNVGLNEREKLFEEVWESPIYKLAKKYSLSDSGLRKKCRALNIPLPPFGYWEQKRAGRKVVEKPELPALSQPTVRKAIDETRVNIEVANEQSHENFEQPVVADKDFVIWCEKLHVPARVKLYDVLIEQHIKEMSAREEHNKNAYLVNLDFATRYRLNKKYDSHANNAVLAIDVSEKQRHRAYCFIHYLIQSIRELKGYVSVEPGNSDNITIQYGGYCFKCILFEQKAKRRYLQKSNQMERAVFRPIYEMIPSGQLCLHFESHCFDMNKKDMIRYSLAFADVDDSSIEKQISDVFLGLYRSVIDMIKEDDLKHEKEEKRTALIQRQSEEEQRSRDEQQRIRDEQHLMEKWQKQQQDLYEFALQHMKSWNQTKSVLEYIEELKSYSEKLDEETRQKLLRYCVYIDKYLVQQNLISEIITNIDKLPDV